VKIVHSIQNAWVLLILQNVKNCTYCTKK